MQENCGYLRAGDAQNQGEKLLDKDIQDYLPDTIETSFSQGKSTMMKEITKKQHPNLKKLFMVNHHIAYMSFFGGGLC
jgi:hypothetical protein